MSLSSLNRRNTFQKFKEETYDLLVIGGGITGAGIALDAVTRGLKVALIEMQDFAAGTSSRSTKLVHGGLRYLKNLQIGVVSETGKERAIVYENGPHVTTPERMLLPMHNKGAFGRVTTSIGLRLYDYLAQVKKEERRTMLSVEETLHKAPLIRKEGLRGGGSYVEYRTDDARLTIEVIKKAAEHGAHLINYVKAISFNYAENGKIEGAIVQDTINDNRYLIEAKKVVNATGPWVEEVRDYVEHTKDKKLMLTKGVHLVIDQKHFPLNQAIYFDTEHDKRMIFAIPRDGKAYVGTTDTVYKDDRATPKVSTADRYYLLAAINYMFPTLKLTEEHIESSWAGIRPLVWEEGKSPSEISRKDEIWEDPCGLITIAGGKLTGYRHMAEGIVDRVVERLAAEYQLSYKPCSTQKEKISGGDVGGAEQFERFINEKAVQAEQYNLTAEEGLKLARFYGSNVDTVFEIASKASPEEMKGLPIEVYARLLYAIKHEAVVTPADFFIRRTGALFFNIHWVEEHKVDVIKFMARYFGWNTDTIKKYNAELETALYEAQNPVEEDGVIKLEQKKDQTEGNVETSLNKNSSVNKTDSVDDAKKISPSSDDVITSKTDSEAVEGDQSSNVEKRVEEKSEEKITVSSKEENGAKSSADGLKEKVNA